MARRSSRVRLVTWVNIADICLDIIRWTVSDRLSGQTCVTDVDTAMKTVLVEVRIAPVAVLVKTSSAITNIWGAGSAQSVVT